MAARAQNAVDAARAVLASHAELDGRVAAFGADRLRVGEATGRAVLPPDVLEARRARAVAAEDLVDAGTAYGVVAAEARAAATVAEQADVGLRAAADLVMHEDLTRLAEELHEREPQVAQLRVQLAAFVNSRTSLDKPAPWAAGQRLHDMHHGHLVDLLRPDWSAVSAVWRDYRKRLVVDADAVLAAAS